MEAEEDSGEGGFPDTRWSLVRRAARKGEPGSFEALNELCKTYWYPLYAYVRSQGAEPGDAADEIQGFFAALLRRNFFEQADPGKGKLRSFLIDALKKYRSTEYRARQAQKRGGGSQHLSIYQEWAEGRFAAEPVDHLTPEQILDRSWARLLLDQVLEELKQGFLTKGREAEYEILLPFLAWNSGEVPYSTAAKKLGISEGNLRVRVHRMRARYRHILETHVKQTLDSPDGGTIEGELHFLLGAIG